MAPNLLGSTAIFLAEATTTGQEDSTTTLRKTATTTLPQLSTDSTTTTSYSKPSTSSSNTNTSTPVVQRKYRPDYEWKIVWRNVIAFLYLHISSLYGLYLMFTVARGYTNLWGKCSFSICSSIFS